MTDIAKRLRLILRMFTMDTHTRECITEATDEIERLREQKESYKDQAVKAIAAPRLAVIEDMRAWADSGLDAWRPNIARRVIDAYAKDRGLDD